MRQLETSLQIVRDYFMTEINNINTTFTLMNIYATKLRISVLILKIYLVTVVRVSHKVPTNVAYFHSYNSCERFVRVSHDIRTNVA